MSSPVTVAFKSFVHTHESLMSFIKLISLCLRPEVETELLKAVGNFPSDPLHEQ